MAPQHGMQNPEGFSRDLAVIVEDTALNPGWDGNEILFALEDLARDYGVEFEFVSEVFESTLAEYRQDMEESE